MEKSESGYNSKDRLGRRGRRIDRAIYNIDAVLRENGSSADGEKDRTKHEGRSDKPRLITRRVLGRTSIIWSDRREKP